MKLNSVFYKIKPFFPRIFQIYLRSYIIKRKMTKYYNDWPVFESAGNMPLDWQGWPDNKSFAFILTHDVEKEIGQDKCNQLMNIEESLGFCSSYNFVPERYTVSVPLQNLLLKKGFEIGVHDLNHDGLLFSSKHIFMSRYKTINKYLKSWNSVGFRAGAMHHNLEWIGYLDIEYDCSTFDTDPFEPQPDGVGTIFPFWVPSKGKRKGYVEMPYTLPQDFTTFILMKNSNIDIWKKKLDWIASRRGMALLNVHPDYINFGNEPNSVEEYSISLYTDFLMYVKNNYSNEYWNALPRDVADIIKKRQKVQYLYREKMIEKGNV